MFIARIFAFRMASKTVLGLYFLGLAVLSSAATPEDYILQVTPNCGADAREDAEIVIITDLNANAVAVCADGKVNKFETADNVKFTLPVSYPQQGSQPCVFNKRRNSLVFAVTVSVSYGETENQIHQESEEYTITCTFSPKGSNKSSNQNVIEGLIAPKEIPQHMGPESNSTFNVEMVDVLGNTFEGRDVQLGRIVQLKGETSGTDNEKGIRPVSCFAIDGDAKYAILRAGCGDGIVFPKDKGFTTKGKSTLSPYFDAFSLNAGAVVRFKCNFVTCTTECDGSSCEST